ncbi:unnamed protein product [Notodromas monacha]|uniref:Uncharacterized protein n=1 Tax=Notodromas monacha TaxID=399045 RepID=A0A7R9BN83_9CRUS|nr:unnamed protein product [Notodromas monacha]CAG0917535.1 unnamed protein product [Notodromas monacha]
MELRGDASSGRGQYQAMHWRRPAGGNENRGNSSAIVASISSPPTRSRVYSKNVPGRKTPSLDWRRKAEPSRGATRGSPCASVASVSSQPMTKTNVSNPRAPFDSGREQHRSSTMMNQGDRSNANNVSSEVRSLMTETPACPWIPPMKQPEIEYDRSKLRYVASQSAGEKLVGRKEKSVSHGHSDDPLLVMLWALMTNTRGAKPVDHLLRGDVWHRKLSVAEIEEILEDYPGLFAKEVGEFTSCEKDAYSAELPDTNTSCGEDKEKFPIVKLLPDFQLCKDYFSESGRRAGVILTSGLRETSC